MSILYVQSPTLYLAGSGAIVGATSIVLTSLTDIYTNVLTMTDFGALGYCTIEPDTSNSEAITFSGITANTNGTYTLTGVKTTLAKSPYTATSGTVRAHAGGVKCVVTDSAAFWNTFGNKQNDEALVGRWTTPVAPLNANDLVNKTYADGLAIAGAPNSSTTVKGIGEVSVAPVSPTTPIFVGDNDTRVPTIAQTASLAGNNTDIAVGSGNKMVTQTGLQHSAEQYAADSGIVDVLTVTLSPVPTSYTAGMTVRTKANHTNTSATPTINVNGLGAKTITKNGTGALVAGDILISEIITLVYDGTQFQLQTPPALTPPLAMVFTNGDTTKNASDASATQNIAHGLGKIPKLVRIRAASVSVTSSGSFCYADVVYNGTTQTSMSSRLNGNVTTVVDNSFSLNTSLTTGTQVGVVTFDATNIIITWTKNSSPTGTYILIWEAMV